MTGRDFISDEEIHSEILYLDIDLVKEGEEESYIAVHQPRHEKKKKARIGHKHVYEEVNDKWNDHYYLVKQCTVCGKTKHIYKKTAQEFIHVPATCKIERMTALLTDGERDAIVYLSKVHYYNVWTLSAYYGPTINKTINAKIYNRLYNYGVVEKKKDSFGFTTTIRLSAYGKQLAERIDTDGR